ncbi:hypothetical protein PMAYCL1PPCAC_31398, partial [Pristionchus mayeri]
FSKLIFVRNLVLLRYIKRNPWNCYTLSIKFQLLENVRTTKLLLKWAVFSAVALLAPCLLLLKRNSCVRNSNEESLWGALLDLCNALTILLSLLFLMCSQRSWRFALFSKFRL